MQAVVLAGVCAGLAACTSKTSTAPVENYTVVEKLPVALAALPEPPPVAVADLVAKPSVMADLPPARRAGGRYTVGKPYWMAGSWYTPEEDPTYDRTGQASWYGPRFHGRLTANGEIFDRRALTAAHPTLPLPSYVRVTNLDSDRSIVVRVNDRGPYRHKRLIDLSERTAELLQFKRRGRAPVRVQYLGKAPVEGGDEAFLMASLSTPESAPGVQLAAAEPTRAAVMPAVAFAADAASAEPRVDEAVAVLTASYDPQARIVMAFESVGMAAQ
jgi:rare lipoprotein A